MVDIHCHLLPGIDDGAPDEESALRLARLALEDGIEGAILTPHHLNGVYRNRAEDLRRAAQRFQAMLKEADIALETVLGSEVHLSPEIADALADGDIVTMGDRGQYVLVEFPNGPPPPNAERILYHIRRQGLEIVLAHPERIACFAQPKKRELLDKILDAGALVQLTAGSLLGEWGKPCRKFCQKLLDERRVHFIATDAHNETTRRPRMTEARTWIAKRYGERAADILCDANPRALMKGDPILQ